MCGAEARYCVRPANGIQCGRRGVVLGGVECAALRVVCRERRGIMRMCCGQQHRCRCWARGAGATGEEGWSHQVRRVSCAGRCRLGSGCPGLPKRAPLVGSGSSQLTSMQHRGWCVVGPCNGCTNHDCRFVLDIVAGTAAGGGHGCQHSEPAGTGKHGHMAPVGECG
jgi:hypothetical protein